jgi:hypothetical protein
MDMIIVNTTEVNKLIGSAVFRLPDKREPFWRYHPGILDDGREMVAMPTL